MFIDQAKQATFKQATVNDWKNAALKSTKNDDLKGLYTDTYENIKIAPLYTKQQINYDRLDQYPGEGSYLRGFDDSNNKRGWCIAQELKMEDWKELTRQLKLSLERGQEAVAFDPLHLDEVDHVNFEELNNIIPLDQIPLLIFAGSRFDIIAEKLLNVNIDFNGAVAADFITGELNKGYIHNPGSSQMEHWISQIKELDRQFPSLHTILINTSSYKEAGAHAVQELGISLSLAVLYIERMKKSGWSPAETASKLIFRFAIGADFFMELSKFRAFRVLWKTIADVYGIPEGEQSVPISAETANLTKSVLDPFVNILRAGNEALAGILGGVNYLHVAPFDELSGNPDNFSRRIARNTQLLLKEEALLDQVVDPAGGSYYIETLTSHLVNKGWEFFKEIDKKGGIIEVLEEGWLQERIHQVATDRLKDMENRKSRAVGVNVYALAGEQVRYPVEGYPSFPAGKGKLKVEPLPSIRLAATFEKLRQRSHKLSLRGEAPSVGIICLGELKAYKPYADFVSGVLSSAGIQAVWSEELQDLSDIKRYIEESTETTFCLCGPDSLYNEFAAEIGRWAKERMPGIHLDIAGKFTEEELESLQMDGTFYTGQNIVEKLHGMLNRWEAERNG